LDLLEASELSGAVHEGTSDGHTPAGVQTSDSLVLHGGHNAVRDSRKLGLSLSKIRGKTGAGKIEGVADGVGDGSGQTTREELHSKSFPEFLRRVLREGLVEEIVEGERRTLKNN